MLRPSLVVRFARGGAISSPTSSAGYVVLGFIGVALTGGLLAAARSREFVFVIGLPVALLPLRDAWAWFAASDAQRDAFRAQVRAAMAQRHGPPPDQRVMGGRWGRVQIGLLAAASAGAAVGLSRGHVALAPAGLLLWALLAVSVFDRVRAWLGARRLRTTRG